MLKLIDNCESPSCWDVSGNTVIANSFIESVISELKEAKHAEKAAKARIDKLEKQLKAYMGSCEELLAQDDVTLCTWKEQLVSRLDTVKLRKDNEAVYKQYEVCSISRRFLVK
jgi:predicted phage-related endonuclease